MESSFNPFLYLQQSLSNNITPLGAAIVAKLLDSQYDALAILDKEQRFIFVNKNFASIIGYSAVDVLGKKSTEFVDNHIFEDVPSDEVLNSKKPYTTIHKSPTGNEILITASPVFDDTGELLFFVDNIRDVTDLNRLREERLSYYLEKAKFEKEALELRAKVNYGDNLLVRSKLMNLVVERAIQASTVDANVFITGESGSGKGAVTKFIHSTSSRACQPFIQVNCAAIPVTLLESELFGYEEGAFSGACRKGKPGLIEVSHGMTLFLDEIGEMPLSLQVKMLDFLQERFFYRVGGVKKIQVDVRVIAATNVNIKERLKLKEFREDLYYRLNVIPLHVPPLRERQEDIIPMAQEFLRQFNKNYHKDKILTLDAESALLSYSWPGNVRELQNTIERLVILTEGRYVTSEVIKQDLVSTESLPAVSVNALVALPQAQALVAGPASNAGRANNMVPAAKLPKPWV